MICIQSESEVLDTVCKSFASNLYDNLIRGETICKSFEMAKERVKSNFGDTETDIIHLLKP